MSEFQYNATGKIPDIGKIITMISPYDTPLMSLFGKGDKATQVVHSWEEDSLTDPIENAQVEGFTYSTDTPTEPVLRDNVTQIFTRGFKVTDTRQAIKNYNYTDFLAEKMLDAMKLIGLDVERAIITSDTKVSGSETTARKMGGIPYFIKTNVIDSSTETDANVLTYKILNDLLEQIYIAGGDPDVIVVSGRNKRILSDLLPLSTQRNIDTKDKKVIHTIDVFEGDFGRQRVLPDRWKTNDTVEALTSKYWKLSYLRDFKTIELPKVADAKEKVIVGELTLEARAEKASGMITNLNGELATA